MAYSVLSLEPVDSIQNFQGTDNSDLKFLSENDSTWNIENLKNQTIKNYEVKRRSLLDLPEEIIYLIFSFLSVDDLVKNVRKVCKCFDLMLSESYFKRRLMRFLNIKEIPRPLKAIGIEYGSKPLGWKYACFNYEHENKKWASHNFKRMFRRDFSNHTSSVDVARILDSGNLLVSGGRDRIISLWNIQHSPVLLGFNERIHSGWIWDVIPYKGDSCFSCDWDGKIVKWSLKSSFRDPETVHQIGRPVLCLSTNEKLLVAGLQTGEICVMDPRTNSPEGLINERVQRSAVMGLEILDNLVVSISEDKSLSVFDLRNNCQIKKSRISSSAIPVSMSIINSGLYVAQTNGTVSLINTSSFKIWEVYSSSSTRLTSIHASKLGSLITASRNACVTIYSPGKTLKTIQNIEIGAEAARIDYKNGILAVARSDNKVTLFNSNILEN